MALNQPPQEQGDHAILTPPKSPLHRRKSKRAEPGEKFDDYILRRKEEIEHQHKRVSIWTSPILVVSYFAMYTFYEARSAAMFLYSHRQVTFGLLLCMSLISVMCQMEGPHQDVVQLIEQQMVWYGYWVLLGIASAIGLGTGLHTFLLFLGPYIAEVTMAAYECHSADLLIWDSASHRLQCRPTDLGAHSATAVSLWAIYRQVRWESFAWGAGTALGELPPYFVARAVALSGGKSDELAEFEAGLAKSSTERTVKDRFIHLVYNIMQRLGFFGILLFASIPNPLFDLAGITCGHFLVPFSTFFGATFLGKACVKASLQSMIVILAFSNDTLSAFLGTLEKNVPALHSIVAQFIHDQTHKIGKSEEEVGQETNLFGSAWNIFLSLMLCYFVISSIESLGLAFMKKQHEEEVKRLERQNENH
ncbi:Vacuolar membrane protease [Apophysomyces sp. BC1034]|nr:Vacuolar membrane protease [Apophysomyces sp. BC1015]KAG0176535.1 Vacuolar membrane protease [Apophysomyces sp. BC1021]KAG0184734.1 Vacuolar membrane protease [Apophysomyces sp. BC1034]